MKLESLTENQVESWTEEDWLNWYSKSMEEDRLADFIVRDATERDFYDIRDIVSFTRFECDFDNSTRLYVAEKNKRVVSYAEIAHDPEFDVELIKLVATHPKHRRQGISAGLVGYVINDGLKYQANIHTDNHPSMALFTNLGFVEGSRSNGLARLFYGIPGLTF